MPNVCMQAGGRNRRSMRGVTWRRVAMVIPWAAVTIVSAVAACRPSDVLSVPPPAGVTSSSAYQNQAGAEGLFANGKAQVFQGMTAGFSGLLQWSGALGDEFTWTYFTFDASYANVDARSTVGTKGFQEAGDVPAQSLLRGRLTLLSAVPVLEKFESGSGRSKVGEAFALIGYAELLIAEDYCAGAPMDALVPVQGIQYGTPLTTDSLLRVAAADFDSAAAYAGGNATIVALAAIGGARARLDRGQFATLAAGLTGVSTSFVYNAELEPVGGGGPRIYNVYEDQAANLGCGYVNVGDRKGGNGLNYVSAQDPRLVLSTTVAKTCDGFYGGSADSVWYYPMKFGNPSTYVPLATGVEARLIEAEAALQGQRVGAWATALRTLRADSADTHVAFPAADSLPADSTTLASPAMQVDVMFRERGFWLYGTGTRLGDLRRLIRQYGRDQSTVFPSGPYPNGANGKLPSALPNYGTDVSLTLPTSAATLGDPNPAYKGCITNTKTA